ncbi:MAG: hypothetical protein COB07_10645 [Sulfurovum sp.]|nr:MAG: hypothetical protein COB07_10645 [Sulfurovum sp.]
MKKIFLLLLSLTVLFASDLSVEQIEDMVNKIHKKREGVKLETLDNTLEPFVRVSENNTTIILDPVMKKKEAKLVLHAIVNGKAYINDSWSVIDDKIMGYTLMFIGKRGVVLRNVNHIKKLYLRKERDNFITLEER